MTKLAADYWKYIIAANHHAVVTWGVRGRPNFLDNLYAHYTPVVRPEKAPAVGPCVQWVFTEHLQ